MACGCPVIASALPGIQVLKLPDQCIMQFHPGDVQDLARVTESFVRNLDYWWQQRKFISTYVRSRFAPEVIGEQLGKLYLDVWARQGSNT